MKKIYLIIIFFILFEPIYSQKLEGGKVISIDPQSIYNNLYEFKTEKKLSKEDFDLLLKNNERVRFYPYFDKFGEIEKHYYIPDPIPEKYWYSSSLNKKPEEGELFPDFVLTTIDNKQIQLNDLKGKFIIICFLINTKWPELHEINKIQSSIQSSQKQNEIIQIVIFNESKENILDTLDIDIYDFVIIPNGFGFIQKWNINRSPTIFTIDKEGKFIKSYNSYNLDKIEILK